jgi:hypothetical protein
VAIVLDRHRHAIIAAADGNQELPVMGVRAAECPTIVVEDEAGVFVLNNVS